MFQKLVWESTVRISSSKLTSAESSTLLQPAQTTSSPPAGTSSRTSSSQPASFSADGRISEAWSASRLAITTGTLKPPQFSAAPSLVAHPLSTSGEATFTLFGLTPQPWAQEQFQESLSIWQVAQQLVDSMQEVGMIWHTQVQTPSPITTLQVAQLSQSRELLLLMEVELSWRFIKHWLQVTLLYLMNLVSVWISGVIVLSEWFFLIILWIFLMEQELECLEFIQTGS